MTDPDARIIYSSVYSTHSDGAANMGSLMRTQRCFRPNPSRCHGKGCVNGSFAGVIISEKRWEDGMTGRGKAADI